MRIIQTRRRVLVVFWVLSCWGYAGQISVCAPQDVGMSPEKLGRISDAVQGLVDKFMVKSYRKKRRRHRDA